MFLLRVFLMCLHTIKTTSQLTFSFALSPYLVTLTLYIAFGYYIHYFSQNFFLLMHDIKSVQKCTKTNRLLHALLHALGLELT